MKFGQFYCKRRNSIIRQRVGLFDGSDSNQGFWVQKCVKGLLYTLLMEIVKINSQDIWIMEKKKNGPR